jgi:hypothetical protein
VSAELANKACVYLLIAPIDVINIATKACAHLLTTLTNATETDLFVYSIIIKLCYTFIVFIRIMIDTSVFKKFIAGYRQFQAL